MEGYLRRASQLFLLIGLAAAGQADAEGPVRVAVSILPQAEFVERVAGERAVVTVMLPPGASPPTYEPSPGQLAEVSRVDLYARVGAGFVFETAWWDGLAAANPDMHVVDCSENVELLGTDPHIWLSPRNAKEMARSIACGLAHVDPQNAEHYASNLEAYLEELDALDGSIQEALTGLENRTLMVFHAAWGYFARDYGLVQKAIEEEGKAPTPRGIARLIRRAKAMGVRTIFASPEFRTDQADLIAREIGGSVVLISPLARTYIANMRKVAEALTGRRR